MKSVILLGASGNIGTQSLDIFAKDRDSFELVGLSIGKRVNLLDGMISLFPSVKSVCLLRKEDALFYANKYPDITFYHGDEGLVSLIRNTPSDMVVNALVGFSGLVPSITSLECDRILCLANKESLVVGGEIINSLLKERNGTLWPIDSEHVALAKCFSHVGRENVKEMIITASGGSFRDYTREELRGVSKEQALAHPTWSMGAKITIDSATMMNKGFEVIEAYYLFNWPLDKIRVLLHKESYLHSALELNDGTFVGDVGKPDMHGPISYALYEGKAYNEVKCAKSVGDFGPFTFKEFDPIRYPAVDLCISALKEGGIKPAILNGANEEAIYLFLDGKISFLDIEEVVKEALSSKENIKDFTLMDLIEADKWAREFVKRRFE